MPAVTLTLAGLRLRLEPPALAAVDDVFRPFLASGGEPDVTITYRPRAGEQTCALSGDGKTLDICYPPESAGHFATLRGCLIETPVERLLLRHGRMMLHASLVRAPYGALLFTGNSGVGKSTQAELWAQHAGAVVLNGDRAILSREADGWRAYGSPYAGSSGLCVQDSELVRCIVLLEQGEDNCVTIPAPAACFRRLLAQTSMFGMDGEETDRLCDLLLELIGEVPVCVLRCTPDAGAVEALSDHLRKGGDDHGGT